MSSVTRRKVKAVLLIFMLIAAEARNVQQDVAFNEQIQASVKPRGLANMTGVVGATGRVHAEEPKSLTEQMKVIMSYPRSLKQVKKREEQVETEAHRVNVVFAQRSMESSTVNLVNNLASCLVDHVLQAPYVPKARGDHLIGPCMANFKNTRACTRQRCIVLKTAFATSLCASAYPVLSLQPALPRHSDSPFLGNYVSRYRHNHKGRQLAASASREVPEVLRRVDSSTKWLVTFAQTLALVVRQDVLSPLIIIGAICAAFLASGIKKVINGKRPEGSVFTDPGMPSSHALVSTFIAISWCTQTNSLTLQLILIWLACAVSVLRVVCGHHTCAQISVGAILGAAMGFAWMSLSSKLVPRCGREATIAIYLLYSCLSVAFVARQFTKGKIGRKS